MKRSTKKNSKEKPKQKVGRPSLFSEVAGTKITELALAGKTDDQVAEIIGVHVNTIRNWKKNNKQLLWSVNEAKQQADEFVEASLFSRAVGYTHPEERIFCNQNGGITRADTTKHYPPDATSMIFWLKNRKPKEWRDRVEVAPGEPIKFLVGLGDEQEKLGSADRPALEAGSGVQEP